jgi:hypothetical protein
MKIIKSYYNKYINGMVCDNQMEMEMEPMEIE